MSVETNQKNTNSAIESAETFEQYLDNLGWTTDPLIDITQSGRSDEEHIKVGGMVKYVKPIDFGRVHSHLAHFDTDGRLFKRTLPRTGQLVARISANEETVNITAEYTDGGNRADYPSPFVSGLLHIGTGYGDLDETSRQSDHGARRQRQDTAHLRPQGGVRINHESAPFDGQP